MLCIGLSDGLVERLMKQMSKFKVDKSKLKDSMGRPLTQSLFLEIGYKTEFAVYTLDEEDKEYKGKIYPSLKRLYLEEEDAIEYEFAKKYLLGWSHWERLNENKLLSEHFEKWRTELELSIRSTALKGIIEQATKDSGFQANKWLSDRGWIKRAAGRPSKEDINKELAIRQRMTDEFQRDLDRLETIN